MLLVILVLSLYFLKGGGSLQNEILAVGCFCDRDLTARSSTLLNDPLVVPLALSSIADGARSFVSAGFTVTPAIASCGDVSSIDVLRDSRLTPSAKSSVLRRSRRSWSDIAEKRHITSYLCHVEALSIIQNSSASVGIIIFGEAKKNVSTQDGIVFDIPIISSISASLILERMNHQESEAKKYEVSGTSDQLNKHCSSKDAPNLLWDFLLLETRTQPQQPFSYLHTNSHETHRNDCDGPNLSTAGLYQSLVCAFDSIYAAIRAAEVSLSNFGVSRSNACFLSTKRDDMLSTPQLHLANGPWKQMSAYAVTKSASDVILGEKTKNVSNRNVDFLPMNVRYESLISSLSELGFLKVVYLPSSVESAENVLVNRSVLLPDDDDGIECDLCDLPIRYDRVAVINGHVLTGIIFGLFLGALFNYNCLRIYNPISDIIFSFLASTKASQVSSIKATIASRAHILYFIERFLHHPSILVLLFFLFGYKVSFETSREPWPSARSQSIEPLRNPSVESDVFRSSSNTILPPLPSDINDLLNKYLTVMSNATVHHATVATRSHPNLDRLSCTANWHNNTILIMGGNDSKRFPKWGAGFGVKLELVHELLKSLPRNDILLFTDAFDVLLMESHEVIRKSFLSSIRLKLSRHLRHQEINDALLEHIRIPTILFSAEFFCHPDPERHVEYPLEDQLYSDFAYLNSGTFIGQVGSLLDAMDRAPAYSLQDDDQRYWTNIYLSSILDTTLPRIELDHEHDVFLCMNKYRADGDLRFDPSTRHFSFSGDRDRLQGGSGGGDSMESRGTPCVIHFNGRKDDVESFFTALSGINIAPNASYVLEPAMNLWEQSFFFLRDLHLAPNISFHRFKYLVLGERSTFWTPYTIAGNKSLQAIVLAIFVVASFLGVALGRAVDDMKG
jgi:hypothetical protein